ncbi:MAG: hypothetical protein GC157_11290 [Frankiales bacterium]|nr:hypothetical protein [Frankiales bacterium]
MRQQRSAPPRRRSTRRRRVLTCLAALAAAPLLVSAWGTDDLVVQGLLLLTAGTWTALRLRRLRERRRRPLTDPEAMRLSSAMHVHLRGVRVADVHVRDEEVRVTFTWRAASTMLLDDDGRPVAELARNALTSAYTIGVPVRDTDVAERLRDDHDLGELSIYGTTDVAVHPEGNVLEHGLRIDQYDLAFASWSGSLPAGRALADW